MDLQTSWAGHLVRDVTLATYFTDEFAETVWIPVLDLESRPEFVRIDLDDAC